MLEFKREPDNSFDSLAIAIYNPSGERICCIPIDKNEMMARLMDAGKWFFGKVKARSWVGGWLKIDVEI
ncbi:MAG: HIRAN domain-containing protein [Tannerella sp.]|nr:HIRAN domain-containing protein [Tannerella sp.]